MWFVYFLHHILRVRLLFSVSGNIQWKCIFWTDRHFIVHKILPFFFQNILNTLYNAEVKSCSIKNKLKFSVCSTNTVYICNRDNSAYTESFNLGCNALTWKNFHNIKKCLHHIGLCTYLRDCLN